MKDWGYPALAHSTTIQFQGDRDYRLGALVGARIAFCLVGVSDRIRKSLLDCAQQCGAEVMPKIAEG